MSGLEGAGMEGRIGEDGVVEGGQDERWGKLEKKGKEFRKEMRECRVKEPWDLTEV